MNKPHEYLSEINVTLDELIRCERDEQEMILKRKSQELPVVVNRITSLASALQQKQTAFEKNYGKEVPEECKAMARECKTKFSLLQELALQNHVLLENNLEFLQGVFQEVFGGQKQEDVYDDMGLQKRTVGKSGGLINVKV
ncbi:MAG: flagellar export chaperone FlgN [Verrucomicrobiota bacterium]